MPIRKGSRHTNAKLTEAQVLAIRQEYRWFRVTQKQLARKYGIAPCTVGFILKGLCWRHVALEVPGKTRK